jgi:hypothetical protein
VPDLISRRELLLAAVGAVCLPWQVLARSTPDALLSWHEFLSGMQSLAAAHADGFLQHASVSRQALLLIQQLDTGSEAFRTAVQESWESGNRFWLWQRLTREANLKGGILNIDSDAAVPLHDHPGASGMLRVLTGEVEVWQFDRQPDDSDNTDAGQATLQRVSRKILGPGETAVLLPESGNIHALRSVSTQCSMLDYFIPPYQRSERCWYQPEDSDWMSREQITCRRIHEHEYLMS